MVCDVMLAISKGAVRPTKIMRRANLTWSALLMYLNALAVNGLVRREERGNISTYHLTERGKATLDTYIMLKTELGPLKLESINTKALVEVLKGPTGLQPADPEREEIVAELQAAGYKILPNVVKGVSGVEHEFGVVARDTKGRTHGYVFSSQPDERVILGLFVRHVDTGLKVHVVHRDEPTPAAAERAREYGIELTRLGSIRSPARRRASEGPY